MLVKIVSKVVSRIRGECFDIEPTVPVGYLLFYSLEKLIEITRGILIFRGRPWKCFVGRSVNIRARKLITLEQSASLGDYSTINALSTDGVRCGKNFSLGRYASIECTGTLRTLGKGLRVGSNVGIGANSFLGCAGGITIGSDTIFGNMVTLHSENHTYAAENTPIRLQPVTHNGISIGSNCWIGAKVTILDGVVIGDNCIVAAGAVVVSGRYPNNAILGGVPAKVLKKLR